MFTFLKSNCSLPLTYLISFISALFSSLIGSTLLAGVIITPGILVHFYWFKVHPSPHRRYVRDNIQAWLFWAAANHVISWYIAMLINIIPILLRYFISLSWGHVSESVKSKIEMYNSVKDTAKPAFYAASAYASWIIIFDKIYHLHSGNTSLVPSRAPYTDRVRCPIVNCPIYLVQLCPFSLPKLYYSSFFWSSFGVVKECSHISSVIISSLITMPIKYLPFHLAFSFYHTAYKERLDTVEQTLDVIEKLRKYRPKHAPHKSVTRIPIFSGIGFPPLSQKQHSNLLSGALSNSASRESSMSDTDNNTKEADRFSQQMNAKGSKGVRFSWLNSPPGPLSRRESDSSTDINEQMKSVDDIELGSLPSAAEKVPLTAQEHSSSTNPTTSPKPSIPDNIFKQATRILKKTVMHDARNLTGQTEKLAGWDVNSAHEAKVRHATFIQSEENSPYIYLSASRAFDLPATERPKKNMASPF